MIKPIAESKMIIIIGLILYLISFLLPAYSVNSKLFYGYECAYIAPAILISGDVDGGMAAQLLTRIHFFLLGLHNLILPLCLLLFRKIVAGNYAWVLTLFMFSSVNTILFFFYNNYMMSEMNENIEIGYYIWVLSGLMILISLVYQKRKNQINVF